MIGENVEHIRNRIAQACSRSGRNPDEIRLIAVSKTFPADFVREAVAAGVTDIGENYVQELLLKRSAVPDERIRWHFVGHLQSNKVKNIIHWIHAIHAVDSVHLGEQLAMRAGEHHRTADILVEVNTSGEQSKFGISPLNAGATVTRLAALPNLRVLGLMTIGPLAPDPEASRPAFQMLRQIADNVRRDGIDLTHLSMGMTNDFEVAIEEGATMVRIGTGLFGKRLKKTSDEE